MNILYIGSNSFPYGLATTQRQILIAKGLIQSQANCIVITRFGGKKDKSVLRKGIYEGMIPYICAAPIAYSSNFFLLRNIGLFANCKSY